MARALPSVLSDLVGNANLVARYGAGCNIHGDLWLVPMQVNTSWLASFLEDSLKQIFHPGESEIRIDLTNGQLKISFCNEGHLHVGGNNMQLRSAFLSKAPFNGISMAGWSDGV